MQRIDLSTNRSIHVETVETVVQLTVESARIRSYRHCLCRWSFSLVRWVPGCQIELQLKTQVLQVPAHTLEFSQRHWYFLKRLSRCNRLHFIHLYSARLVRNTQRSCNSASKTPINANNVLEVNAGDLLHILRSFNHQSDMHIYRHVCLLGKSYTCHVLTIFYHNRALNPELNLSPSHLGSMALDCLVFRTRVCLFIRKEYRPQMQLQLHSPPTNGHLISLSSTLHLFVEAVANGPGGAPQSTPSGPNGWGLRPEWPKSAKCRC